jgi:hypothetical protein
MGTFGYFPRKDVEWESPWAREDELEFEEVLCKHVPNGGETSFGIKAGQSCEEIVAQLYQMHISYLNCVYDSRILEDWKKREYLGTSLFDFVGEHLGYRFELTDIRIKEKGEPSLELRIKNTGFANFYGVAKVFLSFGETRQPMPWDIREWESGKEITLSTSDLPKWQGTDKSYKLYLEIRETKTNKPIALAGQGSSQAQLLGELSIFSVPKKRPFWSKEL